MSARNVFRLTLGDAEMQAARVLAGIDGWSPEYQGESPEACLRRAEAKRALRRALRSANLDLCLTCGASPCDCEAY